MTGYCCTMTSDPTTLRIESSRTIHEHRDGLVQDCSISSALVLEILQSCTKPSICKSCKHVLSSTDHNTWCEVHVIQEWRSNLTPTALLLCHPSMFIKHRLISPDMRMDNIYSFSCLLLSIVMLWKCHSKEMRICVNDQKHLFRWKLMWPI